MLFGGCGRRWGKGQQGGGVFVALLPALRWAGAAASAAELPGLVSVITAGSGTSAAFHNCLAIIYVFADLPLSGKHNPPARPALHSQSKVPTRQIYVLESYSHFVPLPTN